jgi:alkanesulfonate monooxygenase SsuD/methylene tetrahydromethanopterin reductase-like flavin-dependent oxidoreductase (luciferase family)
VLRRAAQYGQGWIPLGQPDDQTASQLARLRDYLRAVGRDPSAFGIEAWIRSSIGGPEQWREAAERWHALGATHVTFYTSGQGVGAVPQQIEAMQQFYDTVR